MKPGIFSLAALAITILGFDQIQAQTRDFTAEVTYELAPGESREDAHVFAVTEARFKVVDQILAFLKSDMNLGAKKFSPDNECMTAYMMIRSRNVQEQWITDSVCTVSYQAGIDLDLAARVLKQMIAGSDIYKGKGLLKDNQRIVDSLRIILNQMANGKGQKAALENERQRLLEEYAFLDFNEQSKCSEGTAKINVYTEALQSRPNAKELYRARGYSYAENKQYDLALKDFSKAIELDSTDLGAYLGRASTYNSVSLEDKAIADYDHILQLDPKNSRAYSQRALIYKKQDEIDLALKDYLKAIELDPKDRYSIHAVGHIYFGKDDLDKALEYFNREIELAPDHQNGYTSRGYVYLRQQKFDEAIADFSKALEIDPEYAHGLNYMNRGNAYLLKGDKEKARADLEKAVQLGEYRAQTLLRQLPLTK
ncbi:MAG TPA: tetratricopeptide repeat protein [bacterium]|jgi:tetratricopeptide (TPR) repeat protein